MKASFDIWYYELTRSILIFKKWDIANFSNNGHPARTLHNDLMLNLAYTGRVDLCNVPRRACACGCKFAEGGHLLIEVHLDSKAISTWSHLQVVGTIVSRAIQIVEGSEGECKTVHVPEEMEDMSVRASCWSRDAGQAYDHVQVREDASSTTLTVAWTDNRFFSWRWATWQTGT